MRALRNSRISPTVFSVALFIYLVACLGGAWAFYIHRNSKDGWSETPAAWMFVLLVSPFFLSGIGFALVYSRRRLGSRLTWIDWCALIAGGIVAGFGALLLFGWLGSMRASGIL